MKLTILALGSRGDVQPFIALACGLQTAGYHVTIAAAADYAELVTSYNVPFMPLVGAIRDLIDPVQVAEFRAQARNPVAALRSFVVQATPILQQLIADCWHGTQTSDALIVSSLGEYIGWYLHQILQIPCIVAHFHPFTPATHEQHPFFPRVSPRIPIYQLYNRLTQSIARLVMWQVLRLPLNRGFRRLIGHEAFGAFELLRSIRQPLPVIHGYSDIITPSPHDWADRASVTGFWFLPAPTNWQPSSELVQFLADGEPPILVSFGSMMFGHDGATLTATINHALQQTHQRGLIFRGWGDIGQTCESGSIVAIDSVPHDWLVPQVSMVVHHGGAGITTTALRCGVPAIVVPFFGDQLLWARRVCELGAGVILQPSQFNLANLAHAISMIRTNSTFQHRASAIGAQLRAEHGVQNAIKRIQQLL